MTVFVGGNSHTGALKKGFDTLGGSVPDIRFALFGNGGFASRPFSAITDGMVEMTSPIYAANLEKYTGKQHFDPGDTWGICMGTQNARVYKNPFWIDAAPADAAGPTQRPVSQAVVDEIITGDRRNVRAFISQLQKTNVRLFVISGPAVRRDDEASAAGIPLNVIASIDKRARNMLKTWLSKVAVPFIDVPSETVDTDGFLKEEYAQKFLLSGKPDPHHANEHYGRLMMEKVIAHVARFDQA